MLLFGRPSIPELAGGGWSGFMTSCQGKGDCTRGLLVCATIPQRRMLVTTFSWLCGMRFGFARAGGLGRGARCRC